MFPHRSLSCLSLLLLAAGCEESFSPDAPFEPRMVIYSVLSTQSDTQFVRIYSTYNPPDRDPTKNPDEQPVKDAVVTLQRGGSGFILRDTILIRSDRSRYPSDVFTYFVTPLRPRPDESFTLAVASSTLGAVSASVVVPGRGDLSINATSVLANPWAYSSYTPIGVAVHLSRATLAFVIRYYVEFEADTPAGRRLQRTEVPYSAKLLDRFFEIYEYTYPLPTRRTTQPGKAWGESYLFSIVAYRRTIELIRHENLNVAFKRAVFYLIQYDENWFKYYQSVRVYRDKHSIRLDEPDFTNIRGGAGVFGSLTIDSTSVVIPEDLGPPAR